MVIPAPLFIAILIPNMGTTVIFAIWKNGKKLKVMKVCTKSVAAEELKAYIV